MQDIEQQLAVCKLGYEHLCEASQIAQLHRPKP